MVMKNKTQAGVDWFNWKSLAMELVAFLFTAYMVFHEGWTPTDLVWALWLSSLTVGWAIIVVWLVGALNRGNAGGIAQAAFFAFHFSFFHFVHGVFLRGFFPVEGFELGGESAMNSLVSSTSHIAIYVLSISAFFVGATFIARSDEIRAAFKTKDLGDALSYASVVKMHIMIMFLGFLGQGAAGAEKEGTIGLTLLMVIILLFHFFPLEALRQSVKMLKSPKS